MNSKEEQQLLEQAKRQVHKIKIFYLHFALYIIMVGFIILNFYVMVDTPYTDRIVALNVTVLVLWTAIIGIHAWRVFRGRSLFKKSWEDRKTEEFLNESEEVETTFWE